MKANLEFDGISTAWDLSLADPKAMGRKYSVVLERTIRELRGESCMDLEQVAPSKQSICSSKMFGPRVHSQEGLPQALASYMHRAAESSGRNDHFAARFVLAYKPLSMVTGQSTLTA
jgi:DNA polymerase V